MDANCFFTKAFRRVMHKAVTLRVSLESTSERTIPSRAPSV